MTKEECPFNVSFHNEKPCARCGLGVSAFLSKKCPYFALRNAALGVAEAATPMEPPASGWNSVPNTRIKELKKVLEQDIPRP